MLLWLAVCVCNLCVKVSMCECAKREREEVGGDTFAHSAAWTISVSTSAIIVSTTTSAIVVVVVAVSTIVVCVVWFFKILCRNVPAIYTEKGKSERPGAGVMIIVVEDEDTPRVRQRQSAMQPQKDTKMNVGISYVANNTNKALKGYAHYKKK